MARARCKCLDLRTTPLVIPWKQEQEQSPDPAKTGTIAHQLNASRRISLTYMSRLRHILNGRPLRVAAAAKTQFARGREWLAARPQTTFIAAGVVIALLLLKLSGATAAVAAGAAWIALARHQAQTDADRERRITESLSRAVEHLASDKIEVRVGAIFTLERISKESPDDYWIAFENLTTFIRERSRRAALEEVEPPADRRIARRAYFLWIDAGRPEGQADDFWNMAFEAEKYRTLRRADIDTAMTIIARRSEENRRREKNNVWVIDLSLAVLRGQSLVMAHLERARLQMSHCEGCYMLMTHFEEAILLGAHFEGAYLMHSHFDGAHLHGCNFEGADLSDAHFRGAGTDRARFQGANLLNANLHGTDFREAVGLSSDQVAQALGDDLTQLPDGVSRPSHWTSSARSGDRPLDAPMHNS